MLAAILHGLVGQDLADIATDAAAGYPTVAFPRLANVKLNY